MLHEWRRILFFIAICLTCVACGGADEVARETAPTPTVVTLPRPLVQTPAPQPMDVANAGATPTLLAASSPEVSASMDAPLTSLSGLDVGLETLDSYRIAVTISFVGTTDSGETEQWQATFLEENARRAGVRHLRISTTEIGDTATEFYVVGDSLYQLDGEGQGRTCSAISGGMVAQSLSLTRPSAFLFGLEAESFAEMTLVDRASDINGVAADRYRLDRSFALPNVGHVAMQGDVWVARPGGYVARFQGSWSGVTGDMLDAQSRGVLTMDYGIEAVNALPAMEPPAECSGMDAQTRFPLPDNAQNEVIMADMVMFTSPDTPEMTAAFFRQAMVAAGWSLIGEQQTGAALLLDFSRGQEHAAITLSPQGDGASVLIAGR